MGRRIQGLAVVMALLFSLILIQLVNIQVVRAPSLNNSPYNARAAQIDQDHPRGEILAANGSPLAISDKATSGSYLYQRSYPFGPLFSQIVGIDSPIYGKYGLEASYDSYLKSHTLDPETIGQLLVPKSGTDTITTIVSVGLQALAAKELAGRDGAVVVLDTRTGAVLAMYSNPTYKPGPLVNPSPAVEATAWKQATCRACNDHGFAALTSLAYQFTFAPGSTSKVVTYAATFDLDPALQYKDYPVISALNLPQSDKPLHNFAFGSCGGTLPIMLPPSCDTGFAAMGLDLGGSRLSTQANRFGYNQVPPLDLPGVAASSFPTASQMNANQPELAYSAIGQQNVGTTALQNALIAAGVANKGAVMAPHLVEQVRDQNGNAVYTWHPHVWKQAMSSGAAALLTPIMENVAAYGTAAGVFPYNLHVAAKTGTAQAGYPVVTNTHDWMIAFGPNPNPQVSVAVVIPWQPISGTGAVVAGPVMRCMMEGAIAYEAHQPVSGTSTTCP